MFLYEDEDLFKNEKGYMEMSSFSRFIYRFIEQRLFGNLGQLELLIFRAREFGLSEIYIKDALTNIEYNESQLACESLLEQMYEFNVNIDMDFYTLAMDVCENLDINKHRYQSLYELVDENKS